MSIPAGKRISICDREFRDYCDLSKHMKFLLAQFIERSDEVNGKHLIKSLLAFKESIVFGKHKEVYEYLAKENFTNVCIELLKLCSRKDDVKLLSALLSCLITMTDNSHEMRKGLVNAGLADLLINQTIRIFERDFKSNLTKSITVEKLYDQLILVIFNVTSHPRFQQPFLCSANINQFKECVVPLMRSNDDRTCIMTMSALTYLIGDDEDKTRLDFYYKIIKDFVEYINRGMNDKMRRCEGLRVDELLAVLQSLSNIETIKNSMIRMKSVISLLKRILESKSTTNDERKVSLRIMYNLSFRDVDGNENYAGDIDAQDRCTIEVIVQPFLKSPEKDIKRYADGVMSELCAKIDQRNIDYQYDVFISYCSADEDKMRKVADTLRKKNYKISITQDLINGADLDDVKKFIGQSKVLLIGLSNSYFNSTCCHTECQQAYLSKKKIIPLRVEPRFKPKDWLGKMIRSEECIDFTDEDGFDSFIGKLEKHIKHVMNTLGTETEKHENQSEIFIKSLKLDTPSKTNRNVKEWTKDDVSDWLQENNLSKAGLYILKYDGKMIDFLRNMKLNSKDQYYRRLKDDLKLSLEDEMNFDNAIDEINR